MNEPGITRLSSDAPAAAEEIAIESAGARLTAARRGQGLSLGDIARQLKISVRQVDALEHDDYSGFAGALFVRGYLRSYARVLHLDPKALLAAATQPIAVPEFEAPATEQTLAASSGFERPRMVLVSGVLVALVIIAVVLLASNAARESQETPVSNDVPAFTSHPSQTAPADNSAGPDSAPAPGSPGADARLATAESQALPTDTKLAASQASSSRALADMSAAKAPTQETTPAASGVDPSAPSDKNPMPEDRQQAAEPKTTQPGGNASRDDEATASAARAAVPSSDTAANVRDPESPASDNRRDATANVESTAAGEPGANPLVIGSGPAQLKLVFEGDSWVQVTDATGTTILSRMNRSGSERVLRGTPPFTLVVGNAQNVKLIYHDQDVDLQPHTRVDVARITLE